MLKKRNDWDPSGVEERHRITGRLKRRVSVYVYTHRTQEINKIESASLHFYPRLCLFSFARCYLSLSLPLLLLLLTRRENNHFPGTIQQTRRRVATRISFFFSFFCVVSSPNLGSFSFYVVFLPFLHK